MGFGWFRFEAMNNTTGKPWSSVYSVLPDDISVPSGSQLAVHTCDPTSPSLLALKLSGISPCWTEFVDLSSGAELQERKLHVDQDKKTRETESTVSANTCARVS